MIDQARAKFGQHVARLRRCAMLSQTQLALLADLKPVTVKNMELGRFNVPFDVMNRVAVVLGGEIRIVLNDTTEYGMECYFFQSLKMNIKRETQYARNQKRDANVTSDNIHTLYEDWSNNNKTTSREKLLSDLYKDFAVLYICKMVEMNFDEEHFYLFRVKYLVPEMTYKKLAETSKLKKVRQKVAEVKQWLKDNVTKEEIKKEFNEIYGDLFDE